MLSIIWLVLLAAVALCVTLRVRSNRAVRRWTREPERGLSIPVDQWTSLQIGHQDTSVRVDPTPKRTAPEARAPESTTPSVPQRDVTRPIASRPPLNNRLERR